MKILELVAKMEALAANAECGPWKSRDGDNENAAYVQSSDPENDSFVIAIYTDGGSFDSEFIAASRSAVPELCAAIRALVAENEKLKAGQAASSCYCTATGRPGE
jgi:hypothetical protein